MKKINTYLIVPLSVVLIVFSTVTFSETFNPVDYVQSGGETLYSGQSVTTQLFIDRAPRGRTNKFWVRVESNVGYPTPSEYAYQLEFFDAPERPIRNEVHIKYFPIARYLEIWRALTALRTFGRVNPYLDGIVICDGPDSTIRYGINTVVIGYDCGSTGPDADKATFRAEELLSALRSETKASPDITGDVPQ